jgi:DNA-binding MarR family transcriptional regulator
MGEINDYATGPVKSDERPHGRPRGYYSGLTGPQRDEMIVKLRRQKKTLRQIAATLGMSTSGVSDAIHRIAEGGSGVDPRG